MKIKTLLLTLGLSVGLLLAGCGTFHAITHPLETSHNLVSGLNKKSSEFTTFEFQDKDGKTLALKDALAGTFDIDSIKSVDIFSNKDVKVKNQIVTLKAKDQFALAKFIGAIMIVLGVLSLGAYAAKCLLKSFGGVLGVVINLLAIDWKTSLGLMIAGTFLLFLQVIIGLIVLIVASWLTGITIKKDLKDDGKLNGSPIVNWVKKLFGKAKSKVSKVEATVTGKTSTDASASATDQASNS